MKHIIRIHPLTLPFFILIFFTPLKKVYFTLYIFIFLHELSHMICALIFGEKCGKIHLLPWGCMLSLSSVPSKSKAVIIFLSGPLLNFILFLFGVFSKENFSLFVFNLIPVMPLDGGVVANILFQGFSFYISLFAIVIIFIASLYLKKSLLLPFVLTLVLFCSERNKIEKSINSRVINHFFVEKK